jgi:hypothetical protein
MIESKQVLEWQKLAVVQASRKALCALLQERFGTLPNPVRQRAADRSNG